MCYVQTWKLPLRRRFTARGLYGARPKAAIAEVNPDVANIDNHSWGAGFAAEAWVGRWVTLNPGPAVIGIRQLHIFHVHDVTLTSPRIAPPPGTPPAYLNSTSWPPEYSRVVGPTSLGALQLATACYGVSMETVTHREMRNRSGEILRRVEAGETVRVSNNGHPAALIVPVGGDPLDDLVARGEARQARTGTETLAAIRRDVSPVSSRDLVEDSQGRW